MAYITPDGQVYVMRGISLDSDYNHTVLQTSRDEQTRMLTGPQVRKYSFTEQSYQRVGRNKIRVAMLADNLYDCNYMAFRNSGFGDKWFYAFIDKVDYINNNTSELTYSIDEIQTWYFDYQMEECFVEREHTETDNVGEHLVPEGLDQLNVIPQQKWIKTWTPYDTVSVWYYVLFYYVPKDNLVTTYFADGDPDIHINIAPIENPITGDIAKTGHFVNGVYMPCYMVECPVDFSNQSQANKNMSKIIYYLQKYNCTIVRIDEMPLRLYTGTYGVGKGNYSTLETYNRSREFKSVNSDRTYTAKNNKLYTYPYRYFLIDNNCGQTQELRWEWFRSRAIAQIRFYGIAGPNMEVSAVPSSYRNLDLDYQNALNYTDFIQAAWNEDSFTQWWAQNKNAFIMSILSGTVATALTSEMVAYNGSFGRNISATDVGNILTQHNRRQGADLFTAGGGLKNYPGISNDTAAAIGGMQIANAKSIMNSIADYSAHKHAPNHISSQAMDSSLKVVQHREGFIMYDMGLDYDVARSIDDYFSMYGYAIKKIKKPNVQDENARLRPHWNYIQTKNAIVHPKNNGGLSASDESAITAIYNKGITFWSNLNEIGDYSLDNSPV